MVNDRREVLLTTNKERKMWAFPKGHVEHGETLERSAIREMKEETGYSIEIVKRLSDMVYTQETGELVRMAMFEAKPVGIAENVNEETYPEWFSIEKAREIIFSNSIFLLDEI